MRRFLYVIGLLVMGQTAFSTAQAETVSGGFIGSSQSSSPLVQRAIIGYGEEMKCALAALQPNADEKQKNRAMHFARTLAEFAGQWSPPMPASWRRHLYAQFMPETTFFTHNEEVDPSKSRIPSGDQYKGRGWIQLTHRENYAMFSCFKQSWVNAGRQTLSLDSAIQLVGENGTRGCNFENIASDPARNFEYTEVSDYNSTTEANRNNDLASVWYFLYQSKNSQTFAKALQDNSTEAVKKIRRGVNRGDADSSQAAHGEDVAIRAFNQMERCFQDAPLVAKQ